MNQTTIEGYQNMRTSEVLNKAADLIEEHGWGTGTWKTSGPLCLEGAIAATMGINLGQEDVLFSCPASTAVRGYLGEVPFHWNDRLRFNIENEIIQAGTYDGTYQDVNEQAVARGQEQVIATLRAVALIEAAREQTRDHVVTTSASHVRIVAARHDLELVEADGYLLATLFVPALGEAIVYQAPVEVSA